MPTTYNDDELAELRAGLPRFGAFFRLEADPVVRLWLGVGGIKPGVNALDVSADVEYRGMGEMIDVPAFQQLCDGSTQRVEFTISDIPPTAFEDIGAQLADQQAAIAGAPVAAGIGIMGYRWQLLGPIRWQWDGFADYLSARRSGGSGPSDPAMWTLRLCCGDWLSGRRRAGLSYWTDQDQQRRYPGDKFCERTVLLTETRKVWPDY